MCYSLLVKERKGKKTYTIFCMLKDLFIIYPYDRNFVILEF